MKYYETPRIDLGGYWEMLDRIDGPLKKGVKRGNFTGKIIDEDKEKMSCHDKQIFDSNNRLDKLNKMKTVYKICKEFDIKLPEEVESYLKGYIKSIYGTKGNMMLNANRVCLSCWFDD